MGTVTETPAAAEVVVGERNVMEALIKADFKLLGTQLVTEYYKGDGADYFLLMPTDEENARGITMTEMLDDIGFLLGMAAEDVDISELKSNIESLKLDPDKIKFVLKMAYFYMITDGKNTNNNKTEYAFQLEIDTSEALPDTFQMFKIDRVGVAVWNTNRKKIIEQMNLYKPQDLLG